jgi:hypothetical protein
METAISSETSVSVYHTTWRQIREDTLYLCLFLQCLYAGTGQNDGDTTDTVHILTCVGPTSAFNAATVLLGMDSYKF